MTKWLKRSGTITLQYDYALSKRIPPSLALGKLWGVIVVMQFVTCVVTVLAVVAGARDWSTAPLLFWAAAACAAAAALAELRAWRRAYEDMSMCAVTLANGHTPEQKATSGEIEEAAWRQ